VTVFTIGFTKKTAREFFSLINKNNIDFLIDVRLNNKTQLAGFTKGDDLCFFLNELCNCEYKHCDNLAPTKELLNAYQEKKIDWDKYEKQYKTLINERGNIDSFFEDCAKYNNIALLCSEPTENHCHRRLLAELICKSYPNLVVKHI